DALGIASDGSGSGSAAAAGAGAAGCGVGVGSLPHAATTIAIKATKASNKIGRIMAMKPPTSIFDMTSLVRGLQSGAF
ncbi:MAG: hypothetical protein MK009_10035, partial [Gammaproteobacteria bacterium]|nr:hypothetical protein [Gammaproteobacteria bacterium]